MHFINIFFSSHWLLLFLLHVYFHWHCDTSYITPNEYNVMLLLEQFLYTAVALVLRLRGLVFLATQLFPPSLAANLNVG